MRQDSQLLTFLLSSHLGGLPMRSCCQTSDRAAETPLTPFPISRVPPLPNPELLWGALQRTLPQTLFHGSTGWDQHEHPTQGICISCVHGFSG